ncbi:MAG: hypothetical protein J2P37_36510 [Ktedonobacteraceae bacterium]|nr:hypothetical protein [Ktedonobacteraceae bacterium]MBO0795631.1 hypothetical protein [Ktedonobacteraceae bacterium]
MALLSCPECHHDVSSQAASCPNCGYPLQPQEEAPVRTDDPDLVRLVEREKRRRQWAPVGIALTILALLLTLLAVALRAQPATPYPGGTCFTGFHFHSHEPDVITVGRGTPCPTPIDDDPFP